MSIPIGGYGGGETGMPSGKVTYSWIGESFAIYKDGAAIWIVAVLGYAIISNIVQFLLKGIFPNPAYVPSVSPFGMHGSSYSSFTGFGSNSPLSPIGQVVAGLFAWLFGAFQSASLYRMALKQVRGGLLEFGDMVGGAPAYGAMLLYSLLLGLASIVGVIAFCIGLFVVAGLFLPGYALVADGVTASDAVSRSINAMKHDWLSAAVFTLVLGLLIVVSIIPCGLGIFVTIPMAASGFCTRLPGHGRNTRFGCILWAGLRRGTTRCLAPAPLCVSVLQFMNVRV